ncbi:RNase H domain-containing protein [Trichonephila clavipes]|nr:RNase H domain-containing protein [Trichonephila clavipes]
MKEGLIALNYECSKCNERMGLYERKSAVLDGDFEWVCSTITSQNIYGRTPMILLTMRPSRLFVKIRCHAVASTRKKISTRAMETADRERLRKANYDILQNSKEAKFSSLRQKERRYTRDRKPITLVSYTNQVFQKYKTVCFTDGSKLNGRVGLACVIYEKGVEYVTFQHRLRNECSVFQAELLCINLAVKLIQDSLRQGGTLNFLICTDSLSSLNYLLTVNSTEKLVVEVQPIVFYLDCDIHFSYVRGHSGNLGNDRADQLAKEATCQDVNLLMSVPLSHWKHSAWETAVSSWNTEILA